MTQHAVDTLEPLKMGDVLQISPDCPNPMFACCFLTVSEVKPWGVQGYVQSLGSDGKVGGQAYIRLLWQHVEFVGKAVWTTGLQPESENDTAVTA